MDKGQFLERCRCETIPAGLPQLDGLFLRRLSLRENERARELILNAPKSGEMHYDFTGLRDFLFSRCLCDSEGRRIFGDDCMSDLGECDTIFLGELLRKIDAFNQIGVWGAVEKNANLGESNDSNSGSPSPSEEQSPS